jgi:integrase
VRGSLTRRGKRGIWTIQLRLKDDAGRWTTKRISTHTTDRSEAEAVYRRELARLELGQVSTRGAAGQVTVSTWVDQWLSLRAAQGCRPSTMVQYRRTARLYILPALGRVALADLSPAAIRQWLVALSNAPRADGKPGTLSPRTVQLAWWVLSSACQLAVREGLLLRNPALAVEKPRASEYLARPFTLEEARRFLVAASETPHSALWVLLLTTGLRIGEALTLTWRDVDLQAGRVIIRSGKTGHAARTLALAGMAWEALVAHQRRVAKDKLRRGLTLKPDDLVFCTARGTQIHPSNLRNREWPELLKRAGLPRIRFHDLRHTAATLLVEAAGAPPRAVQAQLGHHSVSYTVRKYVSLLPGTQEAAAQAMAEVLRGESGYEVATDSLGNNVKSRVSGMARARPGKAKSPP